MCSSDLAHDTFNILCHMFMHFSCICINFYFYHLILNCLVLFCVSLFLSFFRLVTLWHLNGNLLHPETLFILGHFLLIPSPPMLGSMMIKPVRTFQRTFLDEAFIRNTKSFYRTSLILTYPLSCIIGVGSHYVASQSLVLS